MLSLALLSLSSCATEPLPSPGWREEPARILSSLAASGPLRAGAARVPVDPPFPAPMAGYVGASFLLLRSERDPLHARALVIEAGGTRVGLVSVDRVLVPPGFRAAVEAREEFRRSGVREWILGATHAHTAPGAHTDNITAELFGAGFHDPLIVEDLARRIAESLESAAAALEPCRFAWAGGEIGAAASGFVSFNRRDPSIPPDRTIDLALFLREAESGSGAPGSPIALWYAFGAHPTLIPFYLRRTSGDYPGTTSRLIEERLGGVALFANRPSADLAAGAPGDEAAVGWEGRMERIGRVLAAEIETLAARTAATPGAQATDMAFVRARVRLPPRHPWHVPFVGRDIAEQYPEAALIQCFRLGDLVILAAPAEVEAALGARIREAALSRSGAGRVALWTLADEYIGYAFSEEAFAGGGKSLHLAAYGPELAGWMLDRLPSLAAVCAVLRPGA